MKNIDFLPEVYRQRRVLQHARIGWMGVAVLFGLLIAGTAAGQWYFRSSLAARLKGIEPQYVISQARQAEISRLKESKLRTEELAALYLYLEHPWPRTQLLAAVSQPLPLTIQLTDLHMLEQADVAPGARSGDGDTNHRAAEGDKGEKPTAKSVLADFRREHDRQNTVIELGGEAANVKDLHEYVEALARSPLFISASLKGLVSGTETTDKGLSKFQIRVIVHPGYGQPEAPAPKSSAAAVAVRGSP